MGCCGGVALPGHGERLCEKGGWGIKKTRVRGGMVDMLPPRGRKNGTLVLENTEPRGGHTADSHGRSLSRPPVLLS